MKKALIIIAPENFRDEEYFEPKKALEEAGFKVVTASTRVGGIEGSEGGVAVSDMAIQMVAPEEYVLVVLPGGSGADIYFEDERVHSILREFSDAGKIVAAICISPNTLANAGLLKGKNATCWNDDEIIQNLIDQGASYTGLNVTIDGNVITANGPKAAREFAQELVNLIRPGEQ